MSGPKMRYSTSFDQYVMLLLKLHELIREGHGDDAVADEVRDQMDGPWEAMPKAEIDLTDALSGDLYSIGEDRASVGDVDDQEASQFANAMEAADFPTALAVLRRNSSAIPPVEVAILRGI